MPVYETLAALIQLPPVSSPAAAFSLCVRSGNLLFVSGHIARKEGKPWTGQLGVDIITDLAKQTARSVAVDLLATLDSRRRPESRAADPQAPRTGQ
jgi:enamine deaminase RidA (YjgF/YER057c/UK114 family)